VKSKKQNNDDFYIRKLFYDEEKKLTRKMKNKSTTDFKIPNIFRESQKLYTIDKINEYHVAKFKTFRSEWKIFGQVDLYQVNNVIKDLVNRMMADLPENVKIQVILHNVMEDKITQTDLLRKNEIVDKLSEWVQLFSDYQDMDIENVTFKHLAKELPKRSW
jgi:hypothetical protein